MKHKKIFSQVKEAENSYQNEKTQRESMEDKVARQRLEIEELKKWRDELFYELQDVKEQKLKLERVVSMNVLNSVYRLKWSRVTN
jgi:FtsZ-binding cell division protein ZapB